VSGKAITEQQAKLYMEHRKTEQQTLSAAKAGIPNAPPGGSNATNVIDVQETGVPEKTRWSPSGRALCCP